MREVSCAGMVSVAFAVPCIPPPQADRAEGEGSASNSEAACLWSNLVVSACEAVAHANVCQAKLEMMLRREEALFERHEGKRIEAGQFRFCFQTRTLSAQLHVFPPLRTSARGVLMYGSAFCLQYLPSIKRMH